MTSSITLEIPQNLVELSPREKQIAWLIVGECSNKEIATSLSIALDTVDTHIRHIYEKWDIDNRVALAKYFILHYYVPQILKPKPS